MTKYRVPIKLSFDGAVLVEAKDEEEAEKIAILYVGSHIGTVRVCDNLKVLKIVTEDIGYTEIRDNESIEEIEDEDD